MPIMPISIVADRRLPPDLLTVNEAAAFLGLTASAVRMAIFLGRLRAARILGRVVLRRADVEHYDTHRAKTRPPKSQIKP